MSDSGWGGLLQQWLIDSGACYGAGLAAVDDYNIYAAAPVDNDEGWNYVWADSEYAAEIMVDDGSYKKVPINEATTIKSAVETGRTSHGLWIGRQKYSVLQYDKEFETSDATLVCVFANRPKQGVHIACTGKTVVIGVYDEEKQQSSGNAKRAVVAFAEHLASQGY